MATAKKAAKKPAAKKPAAKKAAKKPAAKKAVKKAAGKVQQKTGQVIGSPEQEAKGIARQIEGATQKGVGDIKEVVKDATRR